MTGLAISLVETKNLMSHPTKSNHRVITKCHFKLLIM